MLSMKVKVKLKTRDKILEKALVLFNERGTGALVLTTLRQQWV